MARQLTIEQKQRRRLNRLIRKYGFEFGIDTKLLAGLPEELLEEIIGWLEDKLKDFAILRANMRSLN